jgi:hypothetical protein
MKHTAILITAIACSGYAYAQNTIDNYTTSTNTFVEVANSSHGLSAPHDLDYVPGRPSEWWVLNKEAPSGGSMVLIFDAGKPTQTHQFRRDSHNEHFMAAAVAFAFGANNYFVTAQEVKNTESPSSTFMGPALWSSDTSVYARLHQSNWDPNGLLGSHIDMLHQSPFGMGVAHDHDNVYWYFDGYNGNICKYDFATPHGVGEDDHSDGKVHRYTDVTVTRKPNMPSHLALDKQNNWLYIVDGGSNKIIRMKTTSGTIGANLNVPATAPEPLAEYKAVTGATKEDVVTSGLTAPAGIDYRKDRLLVTDNATGNIHIYNVSAMPATLVGTIITGGPGIMGVRIDNDNKIWYVNNTTKKLHRIDNPNVVSVEEAVANAPKFSIYPNPATDVINISLEELNGSEATIRVVDATGKMIHVSHTREQMNSINTSTWARGMYTVLLSYNNMTTGSKVIVQ